MEEDIRVLEDGEPVWEDAQSDSDDGEFSSPDLYDEYQAANLILRFSVGDEVICSVPGKRSAEGVIIQRFYRESEWPRGYYAAVRRPHSRQCPVRVM